MKPNDPRYSGCDTILLALAALARAQPIKWAGLHPTNPLSVAQGAVRPDDLSDLREVDAAPIL